MICDACGRDVRPIHWYRSGKTRCGGAKRVWTKPRLWKLMELIERGWDDARIGREIGVMANAVNVARKRYAIPSRTETTFTARAVAKRLGIGCAKTVSYWIKRGWLNGRKGQRRGGHRQWMIHPDDLLAFIEDPDHWHRWNPERIPDAGLRDWATELRRGVRFLTLTEAADRACVQPQTVNQWIRKGWLPAVRNGNHLVRESDLERFVLRRIGGFRRAA